MKTLTKKILTIVIVTLAAHLSPLEAYTASPASMQLYTLPLRDESIDKTTIKFSPNGKRFWYIIKNDDMYTLIVDGKEIKTGKQEIQSFTFSPDSKHYAYVTSDEQGNFFVVYDGTPNPIRFSAIASEGQLSTGSFNQDPYLQFSDAGGHYAYVGFRVKSETDITTHVVLDGIEQKIENRLPLISRPIVSRDGKHLGYIAYEQFGAQANEAKDLEEIKIGNLIFDADSQWEFMAEWVKSAQIVYDGKVVATYTSDKGLNDLLLDAIILSSGEQFAHIAVLPNNKRAVVRSGRKGPEYDSIGSFAYNDTGNSFYYIGKKGKRHYVVFNDRVVGEHSDREMIADVKLSNDGKHIGYVVKGAKTKEIYIDGKKKIDSWDNPADLFAGRNGIFYTGPVTNIQDQNSFDRKSSLMYNGRADNVNVAMDYGFTLSQTSDAYRAYVGNDISKRKKECRSRSSCTYSIDNPRKVMVSNGKIKEQIPDDFYLTDMQISPMGKHYAYILHRSGKNEKWILIVDGKQVNQYPYLTNLRFIDETAVSFNEALSRI